MSGGTRQLGQVADGPLSRGAGALTEMSSLSALLPLKISGRHYGDNLARVDLLFSSLLHFAEPRLLRELLIVVRADEAELIGRHLAHWPELPLRIVIEEEYFPAFRRFARPWQVRPWQRQQIIKLNAHALTTAPFVLVLDPDVLAVKPIGHELLVRDGRAILEPESRSVHRQWWLASADLLDVDPGLDRPGMNVTPAVLSTAVLTEVQERLEAVGGRPWMDILLTSYCDWTEFTLYLLVAEWAGLVARHHVWADDPASPAHLQLDPTVSVWDAATASRASVERLFTADDPGLFAVVQSNTGLAASEVTAVVADHFPVRINPAESLPETTSRSALEERLRTASRLTAKPMYRVRRRLRRRSLRAMKSRRSR
jgi:Family of unknown function (DUF6492)